ncbi:MAG: glutamate-ammonia-ligase adenylyltransferase [Nitrosomonadales bacterium]|nr:MAG: glutamate-ammonia-ligase adenylyltransferase [Nitrosomonadales bacterium]
MAAILALGAIYWFGLRADPKVAMLNQAIETKGSPALHDYPYTFRVLRLEGTMAVMATPRSPVVPVYRMIGALYPALAGKAPDNPDFVAAEKELAKVQSEAKQIVLEQPGVTEVKWELDQNWLISHGIALN